MKPADVLNLIKEKDAKFVDLRFTDTRGKEQHVTIPARLADESLFEDGKMFDGSSIAGWKGINESDMVLMPDPATARLDVFSEDATINISCDVLEPSTMQGYSRCPRTLAQRAEAYLKSTGIADQAFFGPENEFFIFDDVRYGSTINSGFYSVDSAEASWNSNRAEKDGGNIGHRPGVKGGYFPVPPVDSLHDIRSAMCLSLEQMGINVEVHHHEVATAGQCEIGVKFGHLVQKGDEVQVLKYVLQNVAHSYGKTVTFMPKPLVGDNGSGMHVHQSLAKGGKNLFTGDRYGGLSELALYYIGGILRHAKALNAFTNASTNSYKRLVPHFEAPVMLAYSARNRSASIRIPISSPKGRRIEVRFPDSTANPYLAFSAMMMAGLDGIKNKINPGEAMDKDLYDLPPEEEKKIPQVAFSLEQALNELDKDREFLMAGDVFSADMIDAYIDLKMQDVTRVRMTTHPVEFELYYSL
ncbi:MAG: glutamine synthetase [Gammaproteobacteria bacterium]|jgi:glutamine synthetase|nr:MAG: glutamate--ammonia ligase [Pseudomonadota bacterium]MBC6945082.1 glutamate--ammonia ligase [Gammaproteobacteria bacterium]MCE7896260.1 glutamate--ammonia ligase [Gammaproteobacteria bacterium PRO8]MDL1879795.1 glutamate--ammonia ligase [Gammaproteobacteria bacterium PRO2]MCL4776950.1 glutamate--ammonia ligase [Gammaproteobacteria bacterium]